MIVSPFTPLFFIQGKRDGIASEYMQTFAPTDRILLQIFDAKSNVPSVEIRDACTGEWLSDIHLNQWQVNDKVWLNFSEISLNVGEYKVVIPGLINGTSQPFRVIDDADELANTTLIQYSMKNNKQRTDATFFIDNMQYFFDFRVHGGFKDSNWSFGVESEQFVNQQSDIIQLFNLESTQKKFTLGSSQGVPIWFGEMLNRILVCSHVYFDGVKYSRKESGVPEVSAVQDGVNSFVFSQNLQQSVNLDPVIEELNHAIMRRVDTTYYRLANDSNNRTI